MTALSTEGMTSIVVTHEMGFARRAADRIVFMERGEIIESADSDQFFNGTVNERARRFLDQILHWTPFGTHNMAISPDVARMKQELAALIAIDTQNPPGHEARAAYYVRDLLAAEGFEVSFQEYKPGRINVVSRMENGAGPTFAFNTHMDVVPVGEGWSSDPFSLREEGGRLYGRGACDCKGPLASMLEAMRMLKARRAGWSGTLLGVFVADEEIASEGAKVLRRGPAEDRCRRYRRADIQCDVFGA